MPSLYVQCSDAEIVRLCIQRDGLAWQELQRRYFRLMYSIAVKYGCFDAGECWDIVQTVLLILLQPGGVEALRKPEQIHSWIMTTTAREAWKRAVEQARRQAREGDISIEPRAPVETPEQTALWAEREHIVLEVLELLPEPCRSLMKALFYEDQTYKEVAKLLGYSLDTISPMKNRCLKQLMGMLVKRGITSVN